MLCEKHGFPKINSPLGERSAFLNLVVNPLMTAPCIFDCRRSIDINAIKRQAAAIYALIPKDTENI